MNARNTGELWVFGYGSLMWRTGFDYLERRQAKLIGARRALCVYSTVHRGTPERPGLVLALDACEGRECAGLAFRVAPAHAAEVHAYLRAREMDRGVYKEAVRPVRVENDLQ